MGSSLSDLRQKVYGSSDAELAALQAAVDGGVTLSQVFGDTLEQRKGDLVVQGEETIPRYGTTNTSLATASGRVTLTYFTARKTEPITQIFDFSGNTAATLATLARIGIYEMAANGDLTLIASTPNDVNLWVATFQGYQKALSATFNKVRGQRYALGKLIVTAGVTPTFYGNANIPGLSLNVAQSDRLAASINGQADLPANIAVGALGSSASPSYSRLLP